MLAADELQGSGGATALPVAMTQIGMETYPHTSL
jgi:hypothetical protein